MNGDERAETKRYNNKALDEIIRFCTPFDVVFLDEALCAIQLDVLSEEKLIGFLEHRPRGMEVILTGHTITDNLLEMADYVTQMTKIKHPYDLGKMAREGIEY